MVAPKDGIAPEELTEAISYWLNRHNADGKPVPSVVSVSGAWGSGKTHWWNKYSTEKSGSATNSSSSETSPSWWSKRRNRSESAGASRKPYLYVSLFGINRIEELENRVIGAAWGLANEGDQKRVDAGLRSVGKLVKVAAESVKDVPGAGILGALDGYVGTAVRDAAFARLKGCVIALDDIERRSAALTLQQVLGFISQLREVRNASVVVILNEMRLKGEDGELLREFREKVMDCDFRFAISPSAAASVGLNDDHTWAVEAAGEFGEAVDLRNIRVYQRASSVLSRLQLDVRNIPPPVLNRLAISVVSLCWAHFEHEPTVIPTVEQLLAFNSMSAALAKVGRNGEQSVDLPYEKTLAALNWSADAMDKVIAVIVRTGKVPAESVRKELAVWLADDTRTRAHGELAAVWELYRSSFNGDDKALADRVLTAFGEYRAYVGVQSLGNAVWLLRELGYDAEANRLVDGQIAFWKSDGTSFEALLEDRFGGRTDPYLLEQLKLQPDPAKYTDIRQIYEFFADRSNSASRKEQRALLDLTASAWEAFLLDVEDVHLTDVITRIRNAYEAIQGTRDLKVTWTRSPLDEALSGLQDRNKINRVLIGALLAP